MIWLPKLLFSQFQRSEPSSLFSFGVQSHHRVFSSVFKVVITSRFWRSESLSLLSLMFRFIIITSQFDVQSHHHRFSVLAFRAITIFSLTFRVIVITSQFGVRSHPYSQFRRSKPSSFSVWHSEPSSLIQFGDQSHLRYQFWHSEPSLFSLKPLFHFGVQSRTFSLAFGAIVPFSVQSRAFS